LARVDHEAHGGLKLTAQSRPVLKGEVAVRMRRVVPRAKPLPKAKTAAFADLPAAAAPRLQRLKEWRLAEARAQAVPAYVILHDSTLVEIARRRPADLPALASIAGIGARKLERYGAALLEAVASG
jgi:ATP-dependent DNA helicase RecQ